MLSHASAKEENRDLLPHRITILDDSAPGEKSKTSCTKEDVSTVLMGTVGSAVAIIYLKTGETCATLPSCGLWLSDLISAKGAAATFFVCGALDFGGINFFLAAYSIPRLSQFIRSQPTLTSKIINGALVTIYSATQSLQPLLISLGTGAEAWQTATAVTGSIPGTLFTCVSLAENDLRLLKSDAKDMLTTLRHWIVDCCIAPTSAEKKARALVAHYQQEKKRFQQTIQENWLQVLGGVQSFDRRQAPGPFEYLVSQRAPLPPPASYKKIAGQTLFKLGGVATAVSITGPLILNTCHMVCKASKYLNVLPDSTAFHLLATALLSSSLTYQISTISCRGFQSAFDTLYNVSQDKPINSLPYQLRPRTTIAVGALSLLTAAFSHATLEVLFENSYPGPYKSELKWAVILGIDIYHWFGLMHLYHLALERLTSDPREQYLFKVEHQAQRPQYQTIEEFIALTEKLSPDEKQALNIRELVDEVPDKRRPEESKEEKEDAGLLASQPAPASGWSAWWCCWSSRPKPAASLAINDATVVNVHNHNGRGAAISH